MEIHFSQQYVLKIQAFPWFLVFLRRYQGLSSHLPPSSSLHIFLFKYMTNFWRLVIRFEIRVCETPNFAFIFQDNFDQLSPWWIFYFFFYFFKTDKIFLGITLILIECVSTLSCVKILVILHLLIHDHWLSVSIYWCSWVSFSTARRGNGEVAHD